MVVTKLKYIIVGIVLSVLVSCASSNNITLEDLNGIYIQKEDSNIHLILNNKSFLFVDKLRQEHLPLYKCCDTIAYGNFSIDNKMKLLKLSTPESLNTFYLNAKVLEEKKYSNDSLYFFINNPIEKHYKEFNEKYREIFYTISSISEPSIASIKYDSNPIVISKDDLNISEFEILINPKLDIPITELNAKKIHTLPYKIRDMNSNVFKINIPELDYNYISNRRLVDDYVKVTTKDKLLWDGKEYNKR